ncbi:MAG TPA: DNA-processing protein DprA [Candidatus Saccharimonadales bacterium]|nr:DNA-processing protein DprA [Candidatus Saccharimonadales bacterium]
MQGKISISDALYPHLLSQIPDPPENLFFKGKLSKEIFSNCLAIVGSRKMTSYGSRVVESLVSSLAGSAITVVSGFMYGVDASAHRAALKYGVSTIAVLPCGVDKIYPQMHRELYCEIQKSNALISEFEMGFYPTKWSFAKRNRVIAGICKAVLVIEAGVQSGALITAYWANKFKRQVYAIPGDIFSEQSVGTNQLIISGAKAVVTVSELSSLFGIKLQQNKSKYKTFSSGEVDRVYKLIQSGRVSVDELSRSALINAKSLVSIITELELSGAIKSSGGYLYAN